MPTRIVKQILPYLDKPRTIHFNDAIPETLATLEHERDRMSERIRFLSRTRDAINEYLNAAKAFAWRRAYDRADALNGRIDVPRGELYVSTLRIADG